MRRVACDQPRPGRGGCRNDAKLDPPRALCNPLINPMRSGRRAPRQPPGLSMPLNGRSHGHSVASGAWPAVSCWPSCAAWPCRGCATFWWTLSSITRITCCPSRRPTRYSAPYMWPGDHKNHGANQTWHSGVLHLGQFDSSRVSPRARSTSTCRRAIAGQPTGAATTPWCICSTALPGDHGLAARRAR